MAYNNNDPFADLPDASADPFADLPDASSGGLAASFGSGVDKVQEIGYRALKGFTDVGENPNDYEEGSAGRWVAESIGQGGSLAKFADKGIARNLQEQQAYTPTVGSYKDVDSLGSAASYVGELTAGSIPYMGAALYPPTLFAMGGGLSNEAYEAQEDKSPLRAVASGYGQIALERLGALGSLGKIGGVAKDAATGKVKSVVKSALGEGATEAGQDALAQWGAGASLDELDVDSLQESFVGGAAVGGTIRTGAEAYNATKEKIKPTLSDTDTTDLLSDPEDAQTPVQQTVGGETVDYDPTIEPSAISPIEGEATNDWRPNWEFGQNDMPINGQMQPYTYEGELDPFHDIPNSVPVGQVLEAPIIEGEFERPRGLPDRSNVIYGEDGRPMQQAQELAQEAANNYQPQIEQKDIIFAGDERGVQLKQDGTPFGGKKAVSISKGFKDANAKGLNPSVVQVNGGYGWIAENGDVGLDTGSIGQPSDQQVGSTGTALPGDVRGDNGGRLRDGADGAIRSGDGADQAVGDANGQYENALTAAGVEQEGTESEVSNTSFVTPEMQRKQDEKINKGRLSRVKYLKTDTDLDKLLQDVKEDKASSVDLIREIETAVNTRKSELETEKLNSQVSEINTAANEAATSPLNELAEPTQGQKEAGNYKKGKVKLHGLNISIENPKGSERKGVDESGKEWTSTMDHHYGDIKGTVGADGDSIDTFIGDKPTSEKVFVVDQINPNTGEFDEHKVMLGFDSKEEAEAGYLSNYDKDWKGAGNITETTTDELKSWMKKPRKSKQPFAPIEKNLSTETVDNSEPLTKKGTVLADKAAEKFEDFGEKLEGAKKHTYSFTESLNKEDVDVKSVPLSVSIPKPDNEKLIASGVKPEVAAAISHIRSMLPTKPRSKYKINAWVNKAETARKSISKLLSGDLESIEKNSPVSGQNDIFKLADDIKPSQIADLANYTLSKEVYGIYKGEKDVSKWVVTNTGKNAGFGGMGNQSHFDNKEDALTYVKAQVSISDSNGKPINKFDIWTERGKAGYFIGKKVGTGKYIELGTAKSRNEAISMVENDNEKLTSMLADKKRVGSHRRAEQNERIGKDYRKGKNVSSDLFSETFGFRGVQFGNYVENDKRQQDINNAYDGLLDLADVIGVSPKALSLNGKLGLAFGARGSGGKNSAAAHYEKGSTVINLTKRDGAGSLAHEWFHALDNYFGKADKLTKTQKGDSEFMTKPDRVIGMVDGTTHRRTKPDDFTTRPEVFEAFQGVIKAVKSTGMVERSSVLDGRKSKDYWSTHHELAARAFETFVIDKLKAKNFESDYLATVLPKDAWDAVELSFGNNKESYPYPTKDEAKVTNEAYQKLFDTIQEKEGDDGNIALFKRSDSVGFSTDNSNASTTGNTGAVTLKDANKVIDGIVSNWDGDNRANDFVIAESFEQLPTNIKDAAKQQGAEGQVKGVFHKGKTYLVLDQHTSTTELEETIYHETYGHQGLRKMYGPDLPKKLNQLFVAIGGISGLRVTAKRNGVNLSAYEKGLQQAGTRKDVANQILMDELLAHMQQSNKPSVKRFAMEAIGIIRAGLRKMGFTKLAKLNDADLFHILRKSRKAAKMDGKSNQNSDINFSMDKKTLTKQELEAQGFDTEFPLTHESSADDFDGVITKKDPAFGVFNGLFSINGDEGSAIGRGGYHHTYYPRKGKVAGEGDSDLDYDKSMSFLKKNYPYLEDSQYDEIYDVTAGDKNIYDMEENPLEELGYSELNEASWEAQDIRGRIAADQGFDAIAMDDENGTSYFIPFGTKAIYTKSPVTDSTPMFSRTNPEESPFILPEETKQERAIRFVQDKLNRVKKAQKVVGESGINTSDSADVYGKESLYYGKVEEDFRQLSQEYIEPIADKLAKADIPQVEFDLYIYALHAKERNAYISTINEGMESGSGMTNQEADAIIAAVNASPKRKAFRDTNRMVRSMIDKRVETMRDAGLIDEETFASLQDSYENYVPLKGQAKDEGGKPKGTGMGFNIKGKETIAALGRQSKAESPLLHSFIDTQKAIVRGHKNEVGNAMLKLIEEAPNPDLWNAYTTEGPTERDKDSSGKVVEKAMSASTMSALANNPMSEWFATKRDGVTHYIKFEDPLIAQQMKNFGVDNGNAITRTLGMVNRYLSMMSTSLNPEFLVTNLVRDVQTAVFNIAAETEIADGKIKGLDANKFAKQSLKDLPKAFKGIRSVLRDNNTDSEWSQVFDQFRKNGAKTGYFDMKDLDGQERDLKNLMKLESKSQVMKFKDGALKFIEDYNSSVENAIRLSVYKNALDNGISQHKAAVLAKNLTVNFNRKGEAGTWLNSLFLFANAGIQGTANFARAIGTFKVVDSKKKLNLAQKAGIAMAGIAFSMSVMNRMLSDDDDDGESYWDKIPEYVKERNFVLMHPNGKDYFTLPMPYGYNVFANMGTAAESLMSGGKVSENAAFLVKAVMGSFVPLGLSEGKDPLETAIKTVTPQIAKPFVDISTNTNFFGSQIYSEANEMYGDKRSDSALGRDSTNEAFKSAAKGLNAVTGGSEYQSGFIDPHPETLRYIAEYLGGGAGATVLRTAETIARGAKGEFEASKTPFIRKVYGKLTDYSDQTDFYNRADEVSKYKAEFSSLRGKERYEFKKENEDLIRLEPMADQTKKSLKQLRNRKKLLAKREGAEEKIKQIDEKMETLVDRFNKRYNEAMEKR